MAKLSGAEAAPILSITSARPVTTAVACDDHEGGAIRAYVVCAISAVGDSATVGAHAGLSLSYDRTARRRRRRGARSGAQACRCGGADAAFQAPSSSSFQEPAQRRIGDHDMLQAPPRWRGVAEHLAGEDRR